MAIVFDPRKSAKTMSERGLAFEMVLDLDWSNVQIIVDDRKDYGETRLQVFGYIHARLSVVVVTPRGNDLRVISLRKANSREIERHGKTN